MSQAILTAIGTVIVAIIVVLILLYVIGKTLWKVAEPNQALIISGRHRAPVAGVGESMGFRIVTGRGALVVPVFTKVRTLSLDANETELAITCVTTQGIQVSVKAVVIYKVGDDFVSISNAARRFLDKRPEELEQKIKNVFEGHLRSIVGGLTVEQMIRERETLTEATRRHSGEEMQKLGLVIDSLQIKEIDDATGYIRNLSAPYAATVQMQARIALAQADRQATEQEQTSGALKASAIRDTEIKKAGYSADVDKAQNEAQQAGPLAQQMALQRVVEEQTKVAQLDAERTEQVLQAQVRRPADAEAYKLRTIAEGERDARIAQAEAAAREVELAATANAHKTTLQADAQAQSTKMTGAADGEAARARGLGQADSIKAQGMAEASAIAARAQALEQNHEAVIAQEFAQQATAIVAAAAKPLGDIDHLFVFNGAEGLQQTMIQTISTGFAALQELRRTIMDGELNHHDGAKAAAPVAATTTSAPQQEN